MASTGSDPFTLVNSELKKWYRFWVSGHSTYKNSGIEHNTTSIYASLLSTEPPIQEFLSDFLKKTVTMNIVNNKAQTLGLVRFWDLILSELVLKYNSTILHQL